MSDSYSWTYCNPDGEPLSDLGLSGRIFATQEDAESWLMQEWPILADAGVGKVILTNAGQTVYGPMSLDPAAPEDD